MGKYNDELEIIGEDWKQPVELATTDILVSTLGRVRHKKNNKFIHAFLKNDKTNGYYYIKVCINGKMRNFRLHRLVLSAHLPNPLNKKQVNHKDGNKANNTLSNLEWVTPLENLRHAVQHGLRKVRNSKFDFSLYIPFIFE